MLPHERTIANLATLPAETLQSMIDLLNRDDLAGVLRRTILKTTFQYALEQKEE